MLSSRLLFRRVLGRIANGDPSEAGGGGGASGAAVVADDFIFEQSPNAMSHASTLAETGDGLVAAWFAGTFESNRDVSIWMSKNDGSGWSAPFEVANGLMADGKRYACWNPVLFRWADGPLALFYKVGPSPRAWWGMVREGDGAGTWGTPRRLPDGILGPIKNKPVQLENGDLLSPSSTEDDGWRVHLERSSDRGRS